MRGAPATMTLLRPRSPAEALRLYARNPEAIPLAGGTDFMVGWNAGQANGRTILDLAALESWARIKFSRTALRIGALATHGAIQRDRQVRRHLPLLVEACATVGGLQIQNRGTLGGNIANASPAGDSFPPLAVYEAVVEIASARGRRQLPFASVFAGVKKTALRPGELIEAIHVPIPRPPSRQTMMSVAPRLASSLAEMKPMPALAPVTRQTRSRRLVVSGTSDPFHEQALKRTSDPVRLVVQPAFRKAAAVRFDASRCVEAHPFARRMPVQVEREIRIDESVAVDAREHSTDAVAEIRGRCDPSERVSVFAADDGRSQADPVRGGTELVEAAVHEPLRDGHALAVAARERANRRGQAVSKGHLPCDLRDRRLGRGRTEAKPAISVSAVIGRRAAAPKIRPRLAKAES